MKTLILLIYLVSISIGAMEQPPVVNVAVNNTYLVVLSDMGENRAGSGSGFAISPKLLVTNNHVANASDFIHVYNSEGVAYGEMEVLYLNKPMDVAILGFVNLDSKFDSYIPMYQGDPLDYLDYLYGAGYPLGDALFIGKGLYQHKSKDLTMYHRMSLGVAPGMSGGPVLIVRPDGQVRVIGIITAFMSSGEVKLPTFALFVSIDVVKDLLR